MELVFDITYFARIYTLIMGNTEKDIRRELYQVCIERDTTTSNVLSEEWLLASKLHRIAAAARIEYGAQGQVVEEEWALHGHTHRDGGERAAFGLDEASGVIVFESWCEFGRFHRENDLPALIERSADTGKIVAIHWYRRGELHRDGGQPALQAFTPKGVLCRQEWYLHGQRQRVHCPGEGELTACRLPILSRVI